MAVQSVQNDNELRFFDTSIDNSAEEKALLDDIEENSKLEPKGNFDPCIFAIEPPVTTALSSKKIQGVSQPIDVSSKPLHGEKHTFTNRNKQGTILVKRRAFESEESLEVLMSRKRNRLVQCMQRTEVTRSMVFSFAPKFAKFV
jgi:hypothetical protein